MERDDSKLDGIAVSQIFGLKILSVDLAAATALIAEAGRHFSRCLVITPNVDHIVTVFSRLDVYSVYKNTTLLFADGMPLVWLSKILPGPSIKERVTGADLIESISSACAALNLTMAFVGGENGVADSAASILQMRYPGLRIIGTYSPPFGFEHSDIESEKIVAMCNEWKPNILCLALGAPKQEIWADKYRSRLECGPILCFGAALDFVSGKYLRAPVWMQKCGLEWVWRILQDPGRMAKRYFLRDSVFFFYAVVEFFSRWRVYFRSRLSGN